MHLADILLSLALFVSGAYIGFRGKERLDSISKLSSYSGPAKAERPLESNLTKERCIYSHLVVEYYQALRRPGLPKWDVAVDLKRQSTFMLEGSLFDPASSDVDAKPVQVSGYLRSVGALDEFITRSGIASHNLPIDSQAESNLLSSPEVKSRLAPHMKKILRITETVIPEGAEVFVLSYPPKNQHEPAAPILVSTSPPSKALSSLANRAYVGLGLGAALILVAFAIVLFF